MWNRLSAGWVFVATAAAVFGQAPSADSIKIDLPADSPVTLISTSFASGAGQSHVAARGGALVMDLHMSLTLRNSGTRRVRAVTLLITAQDFTPGGKASVARPCIDVPVGQNFTLPIDTRLVKPVQQSNAGPLVHVQLDGVLFDDLSFYGPNRLNSQREMTFIEVEAQRDRAYYRQVLAAKGEDGLRKEAVTALANAGNRPQLDVALSRGGRAVGSAAGNSSAADSTVNKLQFAFLRMPDAPVIAVQGQADVSGSEARSPWIEVQNLSKKAIRYVEIGWVVKDKDGNQYLVGSVPGSGVSSANPSAPLISPGQKSRIEPDATLRFSKSGRGIDVEGMTGFVSQVEYADGKVWIPARADYSASPLLRSIAPSLEEQRLLDVYSRQGLGALVADLSRY